MRMTEPAPLVPVVVYTATIGTIAPFQPETDRIELYLERVALCMAANNFPDERKVPALLSIMGGPIYEVLRSLLAPELPQAKSYDQLVVTLKQHFAPKPLVIAERFHFHRRGQRSEESISEYMAKLRKLSLHCEFGDYLNKARSCAEKTPRGVRPYSDKGHVFGSRHGSCCQEYLSPERPGGRY